MNTSNMQFKKTFAESVKAALAKSLNDDEKLICFGLGMTDPKGIFGTTLDLHKTFGEERVFDTPTSENALTGIGVGAAIMGNKVIMTHQRLDFFLLAIDQLVNSAAKAHYVYGGAIKCPITIRLILGRGWGQGPTHSQSLQSWFAHIPGLKVLMPSFPIDAYNLLIESINDPNPVIILEHRWLHNTKNPDIINEKDIIRIGSSRKCREGKHFTVVSSSYLTLEALKCAKYLDENFGISIEVIDLISISPMDYKSIEKSVLKTKNLCVVDGGFYTCSLAADVISYICENHHGALDNAPIRMTMPDCPEPTSFGLTKGFYIRAGNIAKEILDTLGIESECVLADLPEPAPHDIPGDWFNGPF